MIKFFMGLAIGVFVGAAVTFLGMNALRKVTAHTPVPVAIPAQPAISPEQAKFNSAVSTLQTLRGSTELFKIQHADLPPSPAAFVEVMTHKTVATSVEHADDNGNLGPYLLHGVPANPLNGQSAVGAAPSPHVGWVYSVKGSQYTLSAVNARGDGVLDR